MSVDGSNVLFKQIYTRHANVCVCVSECGVGMREKACECVSTCVKVSQYVHVRTLYLFFYSAHGISGNITFVVRVKMHLQEIRNVKLSTVLRSLLTEIRCVRVAEYV